MRSVCEESARGGPGAESVSATLPPLGVVKCLDCFGRGGLRLMSNSVLTVRELDVAGVRTPVCCPRCDGSGKVPANPPATCPWCLCEKYECEGLYADQREVDPAYPCNAHYCTETECERPCSTVPADVAMVLRDMAAERGLELLAFLMGEECAGCTDDILSTRYDAHGRRRTECAACHGTGRAVHPDVRRLLDLYRGATRSESAPA
jgi:hypothetical protein